MVNSYKFFFLNQDTKRDFRTGSTRIWIMTNAPRGADHCRERNNSAMLLKRMPEQYLGDGI